MQSWQMRIALVTGINKDIGLEISRQIGKAEHRVLLGARDATLGGALVKQCATRSFRDGPI